MDKTIQEKMEHLWSQDRDAQNEAFAYLLAATENTVDWAYEVWDEVVGNLRSKDNHNRAIAAQLLCNLAKSDPKDRIQKDFPALLAVTKDERFVTARHTMQALWKVGAVGAAQQKLLLEGLERRFSECITEKNCTLIRYDILQGLHNLYDANRDEHIKTRALEWIELETDAKYRKKYMSLWKMGKANS